MNNNDTEQIAEAQACLDLCWSHMFFFLHGTIIWFQISKCIIILECIFIIFLTELFLLRREVMYLGPDMRFPTMWPLDKCRLKPACAVFFLA